MSSSFGVLFRITTFGESHGPAVGVVIDGCPPRLPHLRRGHPGRARPPPARARAASPRSARRPTRSRSCRASSTGRPRARPSRCWSATATSAPGDYEEMRTKYRPSHADYTYQAKYGIRAWEGGGRASARETIGRVAAGAVARKLLAAAGRGGDRRLGQPGARPGGRGRSRRRSAGTTVEANIVRCPDAAAGRADDRAHRRRPEGRRLAGRRGRGGGPRRPARAWASRCSTSWRPTWPRRCCRCPPARGSRAAAASPAPCCAARSTTIHFYNAGRPHPHPHQPLGRHPGRHLQRRGHRHPGGLQADRHHPARAADGRRQDGNETTLKPRGRHDPCVLPRAVPMVEAMMALVLADHYLRQRGQCGPG